MITANFRSSYRGVASYDIWHRSDDGKLAHFVVEHYFLTAAQYREDYSSVWNYSPEEYDTHRVAKAGGYFLYFGDPAPDDVIAAIKAVRS